MEFSYLKYFKDLLLSDIRLGRGRRKCSEIELHNSHCKYWSWHVYGYLYMCIKYYSETAVLVGCCWKGQSISPLHSATYSFPFWLQWTKWFFSQEWISSLTWSSRKLFICDISLFFIGGLVFHHVSSLNQLILYPHTCQLWCKKNVAGARSQDLD